MVVLVVFHVGPRDILRREKPTDITRNGEYFDFIFIILLWIPDRYIVVAQFDDNTQHVHCGVIPIPPREVIENSQPWPVTSKHHCGFRDKHHVFGNTGCEISC